MVRELELSQCLIDGEMLKGKVADEIVNLFRFLNCSCEGSVHGPEL